MLDRLIEPYYRSPDNQVVLYLGDMREVLPALKGLQADCIVTDPPYAETSLAWDRWPNDWPSIAATVTSSMWCFGSMRTFLDRAPEFAAWRLSQDIVWEKHNGSNFARDRFRRVHEHALHWYRGPWRDIYHEVPRVASTGRHQGGPAAAHSSPAHTGAITPQTWTDDGTRLVRSVIAARSMNHSAIHPTEKPIGGLLEHLIAYACPPGGLVLDPFAGSGSTLDAARQSGRRAIGIESHEPYAAAAARRLAQLTFPAA